MTAFRSVNLLLQFCLIVSCLCIGGLAYAVCVPTLDAGNINPNKGPWASSIYFKTSTTSRGFKSNKKIVARADVPTLMANRKGKLYAYFQWFPFDNKKYKRYFDMIGVKISSNKGKTWTATRAVKICGLPSGLVNVKNTGRPMDSAVVELKNRKIRLYYTIEPGLDEEAIAKVYSAISMNGRSFRHEGLSFSIKEVDIRDCTVAKLGKTWHMYCPNWKSNGKGYHAISKTGKKFKRSGDAVVGGRRNFLGNVVNLKGTLYFYSGGWVATSTNGKRFRLKHKKGLPGDPGIAYLGNKWYGIEAH